MARSDGEEVKYWIAFGNIALWAHTLAAWHLKPDLFMFSATASVWITVATILHYAEMNP
jgi:hypothetical protein